MRKGITRGKGQQKEQEKGHEEHTRREDTDIARIAVGVARGEDQGE